MDNKKVLVKGYFGLGDNFYQYPFIMELAKRNVDVYLETSFPFLYENTNIHCVRRETNLKTQKKSIEKNKDLFSKRPSSFNKTISLNYGKGFLEEQTIYDSFSKQTGCFPKDYTFDIPKTWENKIKTKGKKLCLLKLPVLRTEWKVQSRSPKMEYFQELIKRYKDEYTFVSVSDNDDTEWFDGDYPEGIDLHYNHGELDIKSVMSLASQADLLICSPSFALPMGLVLNTPTICIYGGHVPDRLLADKRMGLDNYISISPEPFCFCNRLDHNCNKEIELDRLYKEADRIARRTVQKTTAKKGRKTLLISRLRDWRCDLILNTVKDKFDVVTIDHAGDLIKYGKRFKASYKYCAGGETQWTKQVEEIIKKHNVTHALIAQKLHSYAESTNQACVNNQVKVLWAEAFFDNKLILDYTGLQYTNKNDIYEFARLHKGVDIQLPTKTRQPQPEQTLSRQDFLSKYNISGKTIALIGQVPHDMALKMSINKYIDTYDQFLREVIERNRDTTIVFKPHPQSPVAKVSFITKYDNVVIANESLESYFNTFDNYISFSSTVCFEALLRNKKVAICGNTLISNDSLCHQMRTLNKFNNLYEKLQNLVVNESLRDKWLSFITTKYAVDMSSQDFLHKIEKNKEEYYA